MSQYQPRQHAGRPEGGQYATAARAEGAVDLIAPDTPLEGLQASAARTPPGGWGEAAARVGSRTPWGTADHAEILADGIVLVGTPGHGGVKLSPERQRSVPRALRVNGGWYEEDCEANIPAMLWPEAFARGGRDPKERGENAAAAVKDWFPDEWQQATGSVLEPGESKVKDRQLWEEARTDHWHVERTEARDDQAGTVDVQVVQPSTGERRRGTITREAFDAAEQNPATWARALPEFDGEPVAPEPPAPPAQRHPLVIDRSGLTPTAAKRVEKDLATRWRMDDGTVRTLAEIGQGEGFTGRDVFVEEGRRVYHLSHGQACFRVSKATWDAATSVPSELTEKRAALNDMFVARHVADKAEEKAQGRLGRAGAALWEDARAARAKARLADERYAALNREDD